MGYKPKQNLVLMEKPEYKDNMLSVYTKFFDKKQVDTSCLNEIEKEVYELITEYRYSKFDLCKAYNASNNIISNLIYSVIRKLKL